MNSTLIRKMVLPALLAAFHVHVSAAGQTADTIEVEVKKAAERIHGIKIDRIDTRHLDGVKGYKVMATGHAYGSENPELRNRILRNIVCDASVFGVVKLEAAESFVGKMTGASSRTFASVCWMTGAQRQIAKPISLSS